MRTKNNDRFVECAGHKVGTVYYDYFDDGARVMIKRGPASINCYLGVPLSHPLAGFSYEDLPVQCHGGLTYSNPGSGDFPADFFWYGYDYAHCDDASFYDLEHPHDRESSKQWTPEDVKNDSWDATYSIRKLMRLAEAIAAKRSS
jgi:hypothetical protein